MGDFVHLHLHSEYSLLDGACRIAEIPKTAKRLGHDAVALTDHGVLYGAVAFYNACKEEGIKPIIGCEVYVAPKSRMEKSSASAKPYHLVLLCENNTGYKNLMTLVSRAFTEGFYSKPRVDLELLEKYHEGLIALSGCLGGEVAQMLIRGEFAEARQAALRYSEIFGPDHFFIEMQDHGISQQKQILPHLVKLARDLNLPLVATNDCHYLKRQDAEAQAVLMCIQMNKMVSEGRPAGFETNELYYKDSTEMKLLFQNYPDALENTVKIADRCEIEFDFSTLYLPKFPCPNGLDAQVYLKQKAEEGLNEKIRQGVVPYKGFTIEQYKERLEYELGVINQMGYADYFLIVQDYVNFAKSRDIPVGPGRGSGCGSIVAYALRITDVDSLRFDLLFERFLNPERVSMPDIDIDFCYERRDEVVEYVRSRYGEDHVSQIITFGTLAARAAVRDVGRVLGIPYNEVDEVSKLIPRELNMTLDEAVKEENLKELYESNEQVKKIIDIAKTIEGMPRNVSIHAAGIVITEKPISDYVPLAFSNGVVVTQYDMDTIAHLGLLKFDFLALRYLTILHDAQTIIRDTEPDFNLETISFEDQDTYELISSGKTEGMFQLESAGMRNMLMNLRPTCIEDIIASIALYRPGPMESIPQYIANSRHPEDVQYALPCLEPILKSTYGCTVYQEQVMSIFRTVAGYSFGHADIVRRAMSKKKASVLAAERTSFVEGAVKRGADEAVANKLFDDMASFASYAFNKSHAAAYAVITYRTAYLMAHYPTAYFAALMTSVMNNLGKLASYITECNKRGIRVLPPDINDSRMYFSVSGNNIRFGLLALKNVGANFIQSLLRERQNGPFTSFENFSQRMSAYDINKRMVESLIMAGCFDSMGIYRSRLLAGYEQILDADTHRARSNLVGQMDMFSMLETDSVPTKFKFPELPDLSIKEKLLMEKSVSGMYFSGHMLDSYKKHIEALSPIMIADLNAVADADEETPKTEQTIEDGQRVSIVGIIASLTVKSTKNGDRMCFGIVEDRSGEIECVIFPKVYTRIQQSLQHEAAVGIAGTLQIRDDDGAKVLVDELIPLVPDDVQTAEYPKFRRKEEKLSHYANQRPTAQPKAEAPKPEESVQKVQPSAPMRVSKLYLRVPDMQDPKTEKAKTLLSIFDEGNVAVFFYEEKSKQYLPFMKDFVISQKLIQELKSILGDENVVAR